MASQFKNDALGKDVWGSWQVSPSGERRKDAFQGINNQVSLNGKFESQSTFEHQFGRTYMLSTKDSRSPHLNMYVYYQRRESAQKHSVLN